MLLQPGVVLRRSPSRAIAFGSLPPPPPGEMTRRFVRDRAGGVSRRPRPRHSAASPGLGAALLGGSRASPRRRRRATPPARGTSPALPRAEASTSVFAAERPRSRRPPPGGARRGVAARTRRRVARAASSSSAVASFRSSPRSKSRDPSCRRDPESASAPSSVHTRARRAADSASASRRFASESSKRARVLSRAPSAARSAILSSETRRWIIASSTLGASDVSRGAFGDNAGETDEDGRRRRSQLCERSSSSAASTSAATGGVADSDAPTSASSRGLAGAARTFEATSRRCPSVAISATSSEKLESRLLSPGAVASLMTERGLNTVLGLLPRTAVVVLNFVWGVRSLSLASAPWTASPLAPNIACR